MDEIEDALRCISDRIEHGGRLIDTDIGGLCRKNDGDEQLEWIDVFEFSFRARNFLTQPGIYFCSDDFVHFNVD